MEDFFLTNFLKLVALILCRLDIENFILQDVPLMFRTEVVVPRWSLEKLFLEISQNSQENTCARVSFLIKLQFY